MSNSHADFTPQMTGYSGQGAFRFWCQKVLPLVYDDSLSYYELLCKVIDYLNNVINDVSSVETNVDALLNAYNLLQTYVNTYFDNLDLQVPVDRKLDEMAQDGTLGQAILPYLSDAVAQQIGGVVASQIGGAVASALPDEVAEQLPPIVDESISGATSEWLDEHISTPGETFIIDTSLTVAGAGAEAKTTGDLIRANSNALKAAGVVPFQIANGYFNVSGRFTESATYTCKYAEIAVTPGETFIFRGAVVSTGRCIYYFDSNNTKISDEWYNRTDIYHNIVVPANCVKMIAQSYNNVGEEVVFELYKDNTTYYKGVKSGLMAVNGLDEMGCIPYEIYGRSGYFTTTGSFTESAGYTSAFANVNVTPGDTFMVKSYNPGGACALYYYNGELVDYQPTPAKEYSIIVIPDGCNSCTFVGCSRRNSNYIEFEIYKTNRLIPKMYAETRNTLANCNQLFAATTMGNSLPTRPLDRGVICVGFDGYNADCMQGLQYMSLNSVPAYLGLHPSQVNDGWYMAKYCFNAGGEISALGITTLRPNTQTFEEMNNLFINVPRIISGNGFPVYGIWRSHTGGGSEDKNLNEYYCRASGLKYSDYYGVSSQYNLGRYNLTNYTSAQLTAMLDDIEANKKVRIFYCSHLNGSENDFTYSMFTQFIQDAKARNIDILTPNAFTDRYIYNIPATDTFYRG